MSGALDGVRVLDLSRFIAGPICAQILGDMGADVVKVERPGGEDARFQGPFLDGESLYPMAYNRNKASITLDTRHPDARPVLEALVAWADVLVENYRPGTLDAMGFGWERLHATYPRLVLASLSGFGQTGPLAHRPLFDPIAQAASGLMSLTGEPDGPPLLTGTYIADHVAGLYAALGTLVALVARGSTGQGQQVDVASLDALVSVLGTRPMAYAMLGERPTRRGSRDPYSAPANVFPAQRRPRLHPRRQPTRCSPGSVRPSGARSSSTTCGSPRSPAASSTSSRSRRSWARGRAPGRRTRSRLSSRMPACRARPWRTWSGWSPRPSSGPARCSSRSTTKSSAPWC